MIRPAQGHTRKDTAKDYRHSSGDGESLPEIFKIRVSGIFCRLRYFSVSICKISRTKFASPKPARQMIVACLARPFCGSRELAVAVQDRGRFTAKNGINWAVMMAKARHCARGGKCVSRKIRLKYLARQ